MTEPDRGRLAGAWWIGVLLVGVLLGITPRLLQGQARPEPSREEGKVLFEGRCVACHTIGGGVRIGPDLKGVTERRDVAWMKRFIRTPDLVLGEGDSIAVALLARYGIPMPNLGLTEQQVDAVVAYLGAAREGPIAIPALYFPTLVLGVVAAAGLTLIALTVGTKWVEIRP